MRICQYLEIDKKMKCIRTQAGISQKDMAAKLKLSGSSYSNYENGYSEPPIEIIKQFCSILNISLSDFFGFIVPEKEYQIIKKENDKENHESKSEGYFSDIKQIIDAGGLIICANTVLPQLGTLFVNDKGDNNG